ARVGHTSQFRFLGRARKELVPVKFLRPDFRLKAQQSEFSNQQYSHSLFVASGFSRKIKRQTRHCVSMPDRQRQAVTIQFTKSSRIVPPALTTEALRYTETRCCSLRPLDSKSTSHRLVIPSAWSARTCSTPLRCDGPPKVSHQPIRDPRRVRNSFA